MNMQTDGVLQSQSIREVRKIWFYPRICANFEFSLVWYTSEQFMVEWIIVDLVHKNPTFLYLQLRVRPASSPS